MTRPALFALQFWTHALVKDHAKELGSILSAHFQTSLLIIASYVLTPKYLAVLIVF